MNWLLQCSNEECESRTSEGTMPMFTAGITVYEDRAVAESIRKIPARHFTCCYCHEVAQDKEMPK